MLLFHEMHKQETFEKTVYSHQRLKSKLRKTSFCFHIKMENVLKKKS